MARKSLKDTLSLAVGKQLTEEPTVTVPAADKTETLKELARQGVDAIDALYAERNKSVEMAASLHQHNVYLHNVNRTLRHEIIHARQERDHYMRLNARVAALVSQARDLVNLISTNVGETATMVEGLAAPQPVTGLPTAPPVDPRGVPLLLDNEQRQFDDDGVPTAHAVSDDELSELIKRLEEGPRGDAA